MGNNTWIRTSTILITIAAAVFLVPLATSAEETLRADLSNSVGYLKCQSDYVTIEGVRTVTVDSNKFEKFSVVKQPANQAHRKLAYDQASQFAPEFGEAFSFNNAHDDGSSQALEDTSTNRLLTIWGNGGFESTKQTIVIWKEKGEALTLETVLDKAIIASIGQAYLSEIHHLKGNRHLLFGRTSGGDGGDIWGSLWIALWQEPREIQFLYNIDYSGNYEKELRIDFKFNPKTLDVTVTKLYRTLLPSEGAPAYTPWKVESKEVVNLGPRLLKK